MKILSNYTKELEHEVFTAIPEVATELGVSAFVIGGFVRDLILERDKSEIDVDIVVTGSGVKFAEALSTKLGVTKVSYFKNFGTAMFVYKGVEFEFVGARKESYNRDSRKPVVEDGTLEDDQNRRDFTINALAISLNNGSFGMLVDPFDGIKDMKEGTLRTPLDPDTTYSDDPLRMMRAVRFATQLGFKIEKENLASIKRNAYRLEIISQERITDELNKIIKADRPSFGFELLFKTGLLAEFFPEMVALHGVETIEGKSHKDNFYHTLEVLDNISEVTDDLFLRWSAIMHDIAKPPTKKFNKDHGWTFHGHEEIGGRMVPKIFKRLRLPLDHKMKYVQKLVRLHLRPIALVKGNVTDSAIRRLLFDAGDDIEDLMKLCNADITSKNEMKVRKFKKNFEVVRRKLTEVEEKDKVRNFQPPINGKFIMNYYQLKPCKEVGMIKDQIKDAILDGKLKNSKEDAVVYMKFLGKKLGLKDKEQG